MHKIEFTSIGTLRTPHTSKVNMPIQPSGAKGIEGYIELDELFLEGTTDLDGFSHLILLYHFHEVEHCNLMVKPFMDNVKHGIFATRSPVRPNPIGMSTVKFSRIENNRIYFEGADMLDGSPLIDIKPFFRQCDNRPDAVSGWLDTKEETLSATMQSDDRFVES